MRISRAHLSIIFILTAIITLILISCLDALPGRIVSAREGAFGRITPQGRGTNFYAHYMSGKNSSAMLFAPTLGNYQNAMLQLGANTSVIPDAAPVNATSINVSTSTDFKGKMEGDSATGVIRVTNARPAGAFTVTATAFDSLGATATQTFLLTVTTPGMCTSLSFATPSTFSAGTTPNGVGIGDFNGDGNQDFAVASQASANVTVLLGDGAGGFTSAGAVATGGSAFSIAVGDVNNDGKQDIVAANTSPSSVAVLIGNGMGGFSLTTLSAGTSPFQSVIGDFNSDGKPDIATANNVSNNVSLSLGNGAGGFAAAVNFAVGTAPNGLAIGDFNSDGKPDIVTTSGNTTNLSILIGNGAGGFAAATSIPVSSVSAKVAVGDFNADGRPDIAYSTFSGGLIRVFLNNGAGGFTFAASMSGSLTNGLVIGDVNGDSHQDIVVANSGTGSVSVFRGNGGGAFSAATTLSVGGFTTWVDMGDFNGDGRPDIVACSSTVHNAAVLLSNCMTIAPNNAPIFVTVSNQTLRQGAPVLNSQIATVSDAEQPANTLSVTVNDNPSATVNGVTVGNIAIGTGGEVTADIAATCTATDASFSLKVADDGGLNHMATLNVTVTPNTPPALGIYPAAAVAPGGSLTVTPDAAPTDDGAITNITVSAPGFTGMLNVDPMTGAVSISNAGPLGSFLVTVTATDDCGTMSDKALTLNVETCGGISFTKASGSPFVAGPGDPIILTVGDLNRDGNNDLVAVIINSAQVGIFLGDGMGGFTPAPSLSLSGFVSLSAAAIADFNLDMKPDLALLNGGGGSLFMLLGDGMGGFTPASGSPISILFAAFPRSMTKGDFNSDNKPDIAIAYTETNSVEILLGNGMGGFAPASGSPFAVGTRPYEVAVGDFNSDNKLDLATANNSSNNVSILLGNGMGGFAPASDSPIGVGTSPRTIVVSDFNLDNKPDLAIGDQISLTILLGNGMGGFAPASGSPISMFDPYNLVPGDFDTDGKPDLMVRIPVANRLVAMRGNGMGGFTQSNLDFDFDPFIIAGGDFNNDGRPDLATGNIVDDSVTILLNECPKNTPPTITATPVTLQQDSSSLGSQIATVSDVEDLLSSLSVTVNGGASATLNGVTVSNILVASSGTVTADVAADCTSSNASFTLTVTDSSEATATDTLIVTITPETIPPTVSCPENITQSTDPDQCSAIIIYTTPAANDNCPGATVACTPPSGSSFPKGVTTVTCTATDASGNNGSCSFTVTVNDTQAPAITCSANITKSNDPNQCSSVVSYAPPMASDNCPGVGTATCNPPTGSTFAKGTTTVTCSVMDASGNAGSCSFTVTVNDTQAPVITCPANITKTTAPNLCSATAAYTTPTASDNCSGAGAVTCSPASGSTFPKGTTTVICSAMDASGNNGSCSFTVTVNDTQAPTISCPANMTKATAPNQCSALVTYSAPTTSDNCPGAGAPVCNPPSGSSFPKGTTTVNCTVSDASGNQSSCSFTVTVNDTEPPTIICPANITTTTAGAGNPTVIVNYPAPTTTDNCGVASVVCNPPSGSAFPLGTTTVTCIVTDTSSNTAQCSFSVSTFDVCIEDDASPGNAIRFISMGPLAGTYQICCGGQSFTGVGTISNKNGVINLTHFIVTRRVQAFLYLNQRAGNASLQSPPSAFPCMITDSNVMNNSCSCSAGQ